MATWYYLGQRDDERWEVFSWDDREDPTPANTGYAAIEGPYVNEVMANRAYDTK